MKGLLISLCIVVLMYIFGFQLEASYLIATRFLFWWYMIFSSIALVIMFIGGFVMVTGSTVLGSEIGSKLGGAFGFVAGGVFSVVLIVLGMISFIVAVSGAWLLNHSVVLKDGMYEWDTTKLALGSLCLIVVLILNNRKKIAKKKREGIPKLKIIKSAP